MKQWWRWLCVENERCNTCHGWAQPLLYFHCSWSLKRKTIGSSKRVEYPNPVMTVFTHGARFLPWSLTFPLTPEGFPSTLAGMGRICYRKRWRQIILGSWRRCLWDTDGKEEAKAGQEARAGSLQCGRRRSRLCLRCFWLQGDSSPACVCLDCGTSRVWEQGAHVSCLSEALQSSLSQTVGEYFAKAVEW